MNPTYKTHLFPYFKKGRTPVIVLTQEKRDKVNDLVERMIVAKQGEEIHRIDGDRQRKRFYTGFAGEAALEQLFGKDFMDTTVGNSMDYRGSDLKPLGLDCGIKTVRLEGDKFPLINKNIRKPQVMNVLDGDKVIIFGLADLHALRTYCSDDLVIDAKAKVHKTCFYGFHRLLDFATFEELEDRILSLTLRR